MVSNVFQGLFNIGSKVLVLIVKKAHQIYDYLIISLEYTLFFSLEVDGTEHDEQGCVIGLMINIRRQVIISDNNNLLLYTLLLSLPINSNFWQTRQWKYGYSLPTILR